MFVIPNDGPNPSKIAKKDIDLKHYNEFCKLYETKKGSDIVLMTGNEELRAHKAILMARS